MSDYQLHVPTNLFLGVPRHLAEIYNFSADLFAPQEALLPRTRCPLHVRVQLQLHGNVVPLALLQQLTLTVTATTAEGTDTTQVECAYI